MVVKNDVYKLSGGYFMVNHIIHEVVNLLWHNITNEQRKEFIVIYGGEKEAEEGLVKEIQEADHAACFYEGTTCVGMMWARWHEIKVDGLTDKIRMLGCVTTKKMRERGFAFARHSDEMRDAFEMTEPPEATELYVAIQKDFKESNEWCVRMCKFTEIGDFEINNVPFVFYRHIHGEGVRDGRHGS